MVVMTLLICLNYLEINHYLRLLKIFTSLFIYIFLISMILRKSLRIRINSEMEDSMVLLTNLVVSELDPNIKLAVTVS